MRRRPRLMPLSSMYALPFFPLSVARDGLRVRFECVSVADMFFAWGAAFYAGGYIPPVRSHKTILGNFTACGSLFARVAMGTPRTRPIVSVD